MKEIDKRESIISIDDSGDNNINNNKDHEYNLDDYIKKWDEIFENISLIRLN